MYSWFLWFLVVMVYKIASSTELANAESLLLEKICPYMSISFIWIIILNNLNIIFLKKSSPKIMFFNFRKRRRGRERKEKYRCERETWNDCLPYTPDQGLDPQSFGVQDNTPTNWATQPRLILISSYTVRYIFKI